MGAGGYFSPQAVLAAAQAAGGSYGPNMDVLDHVLFDTLPYQATTVRATTVFYSAPQGSGGKTQQETNMTLQGQLPSKQTFIADEISVAHVLGIIAAATNLDTLVGAVVNIMQYSLFTLKLSGRDFDSQLPGSVFLPGLMAVSLTSAANGVRVGDLITSGWIKLRIPVVIEPTANFSVIQTTGSSIAALNTILNTQSNALATQNAQMQVRMKGTLLRAK